MKGHARHLMTENVFALAPDTLVSEVARQFAKNGLSGAPVVDADHRVLGFLSETDLLGSLLRGDQEEATVGDVMGKPALVVDEFTPTDEVMNVLRQGNIHHVPVVREGRLVGIITPRDILKYFVEHALPPPEQLA
ncbi:CBS domain-containing protein [Chondromyces apiculatus]|uniref:CBS domain protein n=1 Tax=Chondromyces apiculatus DSM 436 TaxID=1192034 RepID=A0A017SX21_9BACT|nr:CBS domain-containing protein [Chondromyces apiculatus]EYF01504.1 CBS domain protein [Chondromyces apiculatus DSM 436]